MIIDLKNYSYIKILAQELTKDFVESFDLKAMKYLFYKKNKIWIEIYDFEYNKWLNYNILNIQNELLADLNINIENIDITLTGLIITYKL